MPAMAIRGLRSLEQRLYGANDSVAQHKPMDVVNLVALRENDILVAIGNMVVYTVLNQSGQETKTIDLVEVDFAVRNLVVNKTGSLLAIVGSHKVVVCYLPTTGTMPHERNSVKRHVIGTCSSSSAAVKKVVWNPIARYDANLVVLSDDRCIHAYDVLSSPEMCEYSFSLDQVSNSYGVDYESIDNPISIALGTGADAFGKLTLYILTEEGDIFGLCPWVPGEFLLSKPELDELMDVAVDAQYEYKQQKNINPSMRRHYRDQVAWTSDLWKQAATSLVELQVGPDGVVEDYYVVKRPPRTAQLDPQGPFCYQPFPDALYEGSAVDIATIDSGSLTTLAVSYTTGRVNFYLQDVSLDLRWMGSETACKLTLAVLESVQLKHRNQLFKLVQLSPASSAIYAVSDQQAYKIDVASWAAPLSLAVDENDSSQVQSLLKTGMHGDVHQLLNDPTGYRGLAVFDDRLILLTGSKIILADGGEVSEQESPDELELLTNEQTKKTVLLPYESLLQSRSIQDELYSLLENIQFTPPKPPTGISLDDKITANLESLSYFSDVASFFSTELSKLHNAGLTIHSRLGLQRAELHRQLENVFELNKAIRDQKSHTADKISELMDRQQQLHARALAMLDNLSKRRTLLLSEQERKWFEELKRLRKKVYDTNGLEKRITTAKNQAEFILREMKVLDSSGQDQEVWSTEGSLQAENAARLHMMLAKE
jgi:nucleoporin NUP82